MPRLPRLELPGIPMHVTQRGVNRCAIFLDDTDRLHYRRLLREACQRHGVAVHAYVLMDNHVHMLVCAGAAGAVGRAMRRVGQGHAQAFNARHRRSGGLWQGRYKSCLVDTDAYLLRVLRYIELNPVRAAMVSAPEQHRWSSVHAHLRRSHDPLVTLHPVYLQLGRDPDLRAAAYGQWLRLGVSDDERDAIRRHMQQERALGEPRFQAMVERALGRPASCRQRGRPRTASTHTAQPL